MSPAGPLERSETLADDLLLLAAAARHGAAALLNEAEQMLMHALELEHSARDAGERAGAARIDRLTARVNEAQRELRDAERLASEARGNGRQELVDANEALADAVRDEIRLARRELAHLVRPAARALDGHVDGERAASRRAPVRVVA